MTLDITTLLLAGILITFVIALFLANRRPAHTPNLEPLVETMNSLSRRVRELEAEGAVYRGQIRKLDDNAYAQVRILSKLSEGVNLLTEQIVGLGYDPVWDAPAELREWLPPPEAARPIAPDVLVQQNLGELFDREELDELAHGLDIDYEDLPDSRRSKAMALTAIMVRRGRLAELVAHGRRLRPKAHWPEV